jgi:hypothetical protein
MPARTPDDVRAAIADDIRAGTKSCRRIAKDHGVAPSTVLKVADEFGLTFERSQPEKTAAATAARVFDAKAARAELLEQLYGDAQGFRRRMWGAYTTVVGSGPGTQLVTLKQPPLREQQSAMVAIGIAIDKALKLEEKDDDQGASLGQTMINDLMGVLKLAHHQQVTEEQHGVDLAAPTEQGTDDG